MSSADSQWSISAPPCRLDTATDLCPGMPEGGYTVPRDQGCMEHIQRKLLVHILDKIPKPCKKGARNSGRGHIQAKPRGCRVCQKGRVREVLDELCWTQELVGGSGMKAGDTREFHPCSGWAEPIPYSLSPCQSQPPWDSELPKALNLCLPCA